MPSCFALWLMPLGNVWHNKTFGHDGCSLTSNFTLKHPLPPLPPARGFCSPTLHSLSPVLGAWLILPRVGYQCEKQWSCDNNHRQCNLLGNLRQGPTRTGIHTWCFKPRVSVSVATLLRPIPWNIEPNKIFLVILWKYQVQYILAISKLSLLNTFRDRGFFQTLPDSGYLLEFHI